MEVPGVVRNKALAVGAREWLDALSETIRTLERDWKLTIGAAFADATEAFVAEATLADGSLRS